LAIQARSVPPPYVRSVAPHARSVPPPSPYDWIGLLLGKHATPPKRDAARRPDFSGHAAVSYNRDRLSKVSGRTDAQ
jgi:hypothetical protein